MAWRRGRRRLHALLLSCISDRLKWASAPKKCGTPASLTICPIRLRKVTVHAVMPVTVVRRVRQRAVEPVEFPDHKVAIFPEERHGAC